MRKAIIILLSLIITYSFSVGCKKASPTESPVEVTVIVTASPTPVQTLVIQCEKDSSVISSTSYMDYNFGVCTYLYVNGNSDNRYAILDFNISSIPQGVTLTSAVLTVYGYSGSGFQVARVRSIASADWIEGSKCLAAAAGGVTWNNFQYSSAGHASVVMSDYVVFSETSRFIEIELDPEKMQDVVDGTNSDFYGFIILPADTDTEFIYLESREGATGYAPTLTLEWE